jgi:hypothetical protein
VQDAASAPRPATPSPAPVATSGAAPPPPQSQPPGISGGKVEPPAQDQKKKKGFWGRVFGRGGGG